MMGFGAGLSGFKHEGLPRPAASAKLHLSTGCTKHLFAKQSVEVDMKLGVMAALFGGMKFDDALFYCQELGLDAI